jgi:hypothetical protein
MAFAELRDVFEMGAGLEEAIDEMIDTSCAAGATR